MQPQTISDAFLYTVSRMHDRIALRSKVGDSWAEWTFGDVADRVARAAAGFQAIGVRPGDHVVLMLRNTPEFHIADLALLFCGATPVSIYNSSSPEQIAYLAGHCQAKLAVIDDVELLARFDAVKDQLPELRTRVLVDPPERFVGAIAWTELLSHDGVDLVSAAALVSPSDAATVIYTSGTTGAPKGVIVSHTALISEIEGMSRRCDRDLSGLRVVSYLPMAHVAERVVSHYFMACHGVQVTCCPDTAELPQYLLDVRPQILFAPPRIWEKTRAKVMTALSAEPSRADQFVKAVDDALPIALARAQGGATADQNAAWDRMQDDLFHEVRRSLGLDDVLFGITGAGPIRVEVIEWFVAVGVPLSEAYGMSENTGAISWSPVGAPPGSVGRPLPGAQTRLAPDGEVLMRGPMVFSGYLGDPVRTAEAFTDDGWLRSGDIGTVDADGYLTITGRKKELIVTAGGKNVSPANLEAAIMGHPLVGQACVVGDGRPYPAALVTLDAEAVSAWAARHGLPVEPVASLAAQPVLLDAIGRHIDEAMTVFSRAERVKRFHVMDSEWLPDSEELTPTLKLKRHVIAAKYVAEIDALYS